jgi:RNA-directed DNA polymerase
MMHDPEKSDSPIVAMKPTNKPANAGAESVEPRGGAEGITDKYRTTRTPSRTRVLQALALVRERAKAHRKERFTALLHHVDVDLLRCAYFWLKKDAAAGVDGVTWGGYGQDMEARLIDLQGVFTAVRIVRNLRGGSSFLNRMDVNGRWGSLR